MSTVAFFPELREFLRSEGCIYTVRNYQAPAVSLVRVEGVGECRRERVSMVLDIQDIAHCSSKSGFDSVLKWWDKIKKLYPTLKGLYLYKVEVVTKGGA